MAVDLKPVELPADLSWIGAMCRVLPVGLQGKLEPFCTELAKPIEKPAA
ncbi:unnamed protein product [marine sediment metagenome]|uniref:Uncharacterized protein n=1 Tax=marine sediment metagenome TaxID=412755 RepID=X1RCC5_9ZZZZ